MTTTLIAPPQAKKRSLADEMAKAGIKPLSEQTASTGSQSTQKRSLKDEMEKAGIKPLSTTVSNFQNQAMGDFDLKNPAMGMNVAKAAGNVVMGAAKGVVNLPFEAAQLGKSIGDLGAKYIGRPLVKKIVGSNELSLPPGVSALKQGMDQGTQVPDVFKPQGTAQKVGFGMEKIGEFFVPIGAAAKVGSTAGKFARVAEEIPTLAKLPGGTIAKVATEGKVLNGLAGMVQKLPKLVRAPANLLGKAVSEGTEQAARSALQKGDIKDVGKDFGIGAAFPVAGVALKSIGKVGGWALKTMASGMSGVPKAAIEHAVKNPDAVGRAIKTMADNPEVGPAMVLQKAEDALQELKDIRRADYLEGLKQIEMHDKPIMDSIEPIREAAAKSMDRFKIAIDDAGNVAWTKKTVLPQSYKADLQEVYGRVKDWDDFTATGMDDLREVLDGYYRAGINPSKAEKQFNAILTDLKSKIVEKLPQEVRGLNRDYAQQSEFIETLRRELSLDKDKPVSAMRKLMNMFNDKSEVYKPLIDMMGEGTAKDISSDVAGVIMSKWMPTGFGKYLTTGAGLAALTSPATLAAIPFSMPRLVGESATRLGKIQKTGMVERGEDVLSRFLKGASAQLPNQ